jgi:glycosyltransferase involved in cell wall biosynthesis
MKIGFDGRYAEGDLVGVGKYIKNILLELDKLGIECVIFYSSPPKIKIEGENIKSVVLGFKNRYIFEQILLPLALKREKVDMYHALGNIGVPLFCPIPAIVTIHDIIPLEIKDYFSYSPLPFLSRFSYTTRLISSLKNANKIIAVSNYVKTQVIQKLKINKEKIKVIYSGAPEVVQPGNLPKDLVGKKYILNHGGMDIRKNLDRLIEAFASTHAKYPQLNLVITGENKRIKADLAKLISKLKLDDSVIFTGYVDDMTLSAIIKNAIMECYPTLSEGFGFPILESFALGIPVISSNTSAIPEASGRGAILIDPHSVTQISEAMEKVLTDTELRNNMVIQGKSQYNRFNWEKTANEYLSLYNSI